MSPRACSSATSCVKPNVRRELRGETLRRHVIGARLPPDQRMRPLDRHRQTQRLRRRHHVRRVLVGHGEGCRDREHRGLATHGGRPRLRERVEIRQHAAVEDRRLGARELDREIVDHMGGHGRQHMLDRVNRRRAVPDRRASLDRLDLRQPRRDLGPPREIDPPEQDPLAGRRREECRFRRGAGMQPRAANARGPRDGAPSARWRQGEARVWIARGLRARRRSLRGGTSRPGRAAAHGAGARDTRRR